MKIDVKIKFEGKSGSGKTLIGDKIKMFLEHEGLKVKYIDEDEHSLEVKSNDN